MVGRKVFIPQLPIAFIPGTQDRREQQQTDCQYAYDTHSPPKEARGAHRPVPVTLQTRFRVELAISRTPWCLSQYQCLSALHVMPSARKDGEGMHPRR